MYISCPEGGQGGAGPPPGTHGKTCARSTVLHGEDLGGAAWDAWGQGHMVNARVSYHVTWKGLWEAERPPGTHGNTRARSLPQEHMVKRVPSETW